MAAALGLARRGLGAVWPNPAVGCVLVRDGRVVGRGWTQPGGRPHAETEALARAGSEAQGATAYVTLEPCAHRGETPPCAEALIEAGIARAVIAVDDSDSRVSGRGRKRLAAAGIVVHTGVCGAEAEALNAGFFLRIRAGRPLVTLKTATTLDARIATHGGESQWITGERARARAHLLRARHDAVLVGIGTAIADDPRLDCRLPGLGARAPVRIVVDARLRLPLTSTLVRTAQRQPVWLITRKGGDAGRRAAFREAGVALIDVAHDADGNLDLADAMTALGKRGLTRVLVEGGGRIAAALVRANLVDRLVWFRSPSLIGGDGLAAVSAFGIDRLADAPRFRRVDTLPLGDDLMETYERIS